MTFNGSKNQGRCGIGFVWCAFSKIHPTVLCKVLNVCNSLLKLGRPFLHSLLQPGRFAFPLSNLVIAVERITRQNENRDWISFVEPKQNRAFKLSDCGLVFVYNKDGRTRIGLRFSAWLAAHFTKPCSKRYVRPFSINPQTGSPVSSSSPKKWIIFACHKTSL